MKVKQNLPEVQIYQKKCKIYQKKFKFTGRSLNSPEEAQKLPEEVLIYQKKCKNTS
jgi:hypothetical protein